MSTSITWKAVLNSILMLGVTVLTCMLPNSAQALDFNKISEVYFFGDSLTDSGFNDIWPHLPSIPPGGLPGLPLNKAPTFTTLGGYTWSQYVARDIKNYTLPGVYPNPIPMDSMTNNAIYKITNPAPVFTSGILTGVNYAAGGSTTNSTGVDYTWAPSLNQQITQYLSTTTQVLDPNAVYFIWSGSNDILGLFDFFKPEPSLQQLLTTAMTATSNIANAVEQLSARGAQRIVVLSLANFGPSPAVTLLSELYPDPNLPKTMQLVSFSFNAMLNTALGKVSTKYNSKILLIDTYTILDDVIATVPTGKPYVVAGQSFIFTNATDPVCGDAIKAIACPNGPEGHVFADVVHPTDTTHQVLALEVEKRILQWQ